MAQQHTLLLPDGQRIHYTVEKRQRRTIGLKVTQEGLTIHAPKRLSQQDLEAVILQKATWIINKLNALKIEELAPFVWQTGEELLYLGQTIQLLLQETKKSKNIILKDGFLQVALPTVADEALIAKHVITWYKKTAINDFNQRLSVFAKQLGVAKPTLFLSSAKTRWGSCNHRQEVRLNWRLLQAPSYIINYVVCHELAHLIEMNHSAKFWQVVERICPEYRAAEKALKTVSQRLYRMQ